MKFHQSNQKSRNHRLDPYWNWGRFIRFVFETPRRTSRQRASWRHGNIWQALGSSLCYLLLMGLSQYWQGFIHLRWFVWDFFHQQYYSGFNLKNWCQIRKLATTHNSLFSIKSPKRWENTRGFSRVPIRTQEYNNDVCICIWMHRNQPESRQQFLPSTRQTSKEIKSD